MDGPPLWQEGQVLAATNAHFEPDRLTLFQADYVTEDLHASPANSPLHLQERLLPRPKPHPARTVVEVRDDSIPTGEWSDRLQDSVPDRINATARHAAYFSPERLAAGHAPRQV